MKHYRAATLYFLLAAFAGLSALPALADTAPVPPPTGGNTVPVPINGGMDRTYAVHAAATANSITRSASEGSKNLQEYQAPEPFLNDGGRKPSQKDTALYQAELLKFGYRMVMERSGDPDGNRLREQLNSAPIRRLLQLTTQARFNDKFTLYSPQVLYSDPLHGTDVAVQSLQGSQSGFGALVGYGFGLRITTDNVGLPELRALERVIIALQRTISNLHDFYSFPEYQNDFNVLFSLTPDGRADDRTIVLTPERRQALQNLLSHQFVPILINGLAKNLIDLHDSGLALANALEYNSVKSLRSAFLLDHSFLNDIGGLTEYGFGFSKQDRFTHLTLSAVVGGLTYTPGGRSKTPGTANSTVLSSHIGLYWQDRLLKFDRSNPPIRRPGVNNPGISGNYLPPCYSWCWMVGVEYSPRNAIYGQEGYGAVIRYRPTHDDEIQVNGGRLSGNAWYTGIGYTRTFSFR